MESKQILYKALTAEGTGCHIAGMDSVAWLLQSPDFTDEVRRKIRRAMTGRTMQGSGADQDRRGSTVDFEFQDEVTLQAGPLTGRGCAVKWHCTGWATASDSTGTFRRRAWPEGTVEVVFPDLEEGETLAGAWARTGRDLKLDLDGLG